MATLLIQKLKLKLQKYFWIYITNDFIIRDINNINMVEPSLQCKFIPITMENYHRVADFREEGRILQYRDKLARKEIGFFAEHCGEMISSFWATINKTDVPIVVKAYMRVGPNEAFLHDLVTGEKSRGMRVGTFMVSQIAAALLKEYGVNRIIFDINVRNRASMRMMDRLGLWIDHKTLTVSAFGQLVLQLVFKRYA